MSLPELSLSVWGEATSISTMFNQWQKGTWQDYISYRDDLSNQKLGLFFNHNALFLELGNEGVNHGKINDLMVLIFFIWFNHWPEQTAESLSRCLLEKERVYAACPDLILYVNETLPQFNNEGLRLIDLNLWRVPDLVGEIADWTLATDLTEKKQIYAALAIPEYWVVDVQMRRLLAFRLTGLGEYQQCWRSRALKGLPISLIEQTIQRLNEETNLQAASWFAQAITHL